MAEALGVIASGVSIAALAGQIASGVVKLKSYLDQVKDAPEDLHVLINEIDDLRFLISDIEDDQLRNPFPDICLDNALVSRCLSHCKRGAERLHRVVDDMEAQFESHRSMRRWNAAKIIWRRDRVDKYRAELAGAVRLLTLSYQIYTRSLIQLQPDIITARLTQLVEIESAKRASMISPSSTALAQGSSSSIRKDHTAVPCVSKKTQYTWFRWRSYLALIERAWHIEIYKSQRGWNFTMSVYACVAYDSPVAQYTSNGNVEGLQSLFARGEASPFTVCFDDYPHSRPKTLLEIGANRADFKLCKFLIENGADRTYSAYYSHLGPINWFVENGGMYKQPSTDSCQLARLLGTGTEMTLGMLAGYRGPASVFSILQGQMDTPISKLPIEERCRLATYLAMDAESNKPDLFLMALNYELIPGTFKMDEDCVMALLPAAAGSIGHLAYWGWSMHEDMHEEILGCWISDEMLGWISIIEELVAAGADLHATVSLHYSRASFMGVKTDSPVTPFTFMLANAISDYWVQRATQNLKIAMTIWIWTLFNSGVSLQVYGERESLTWVNLETCRSPPRGDYHVGQIRLLGFEFGPSPHDWKIWQNEPRDEFAGDFWQMTERRVEGMPGTWVE